MTREEMVALGRDEVGYEEGARNQVSALSARVEERIKFHAERAQVLRGVHANGETGVRRLYEWHEDQIEWLRALAPKEASK
jgi:hypothetical protein